MKKVVRVILIDNAEIVYKTLNDIIKNQLIENKQNTIEMKLLKSINKKIDLIKNNPFYGDNIQKNLIPKKYFQTNMWRVELFNFWRMLYTIEGSKIEILVFVLKIMNHKDYDKLFGYK